MNPSNEWLGGDLPYDAQKLKKELLERPDMDDLIADTIVRCPKDVYETLCRKRKAGELKLQTPARGGILKSGRVEPLEPEKIIDINKEETKCELSVQD